MRPRKQIQLGRQLKARRTDVDLTLRAVAREMTELQSSIPNMTHPAAQVGATDASNVEIARGDTPMPTTALPPGGQYSRAVDTQSVTPVSTAHSHTASPDSSRLAALAASARVLASLRAADPLRNWRGTSQLARDVGPLRQLLDTAVQARRHGRRVAGRT